MTLKANLFLALVATTFAAISSYAIGSVKDGIDVQLKYGDHRNHDHDHDHDHDYNNVIKEFDCPATYGRYPHPKRCEYYFECRSGEAELKQCRRGDLYDKSRAQCRDRRKVRCHRDGKDDDDDDDDSSEEKEEKKFKCPSTWGSFPHPVDCSKYYVCLYKVATLHQCRSSELYDERTRRCIHRSRVNCGGRIDRENFKTTTERIVTTSRKGKTTRRDKTTTTRYPKTTTVSTTTENPNRYLCPFPKGRFADPDDCSRYYDCRSGVAKAKRCHRNELYDERKEECRDKRKVRCGDRPNGDDDVPVKDEKLRCPYTWGTFYHPKDCSKYIVCVYNLPTVYVCRKSQLFDAFSRRCRSSRYVNCGKRINPDDLLPPDKTTTTRKYSTTTKRPVSTISTTESVTTTTTPQRTSAAYKETTEQEITSKSEEIRTETWTVTNEESTTEEQSKTPDENRTNQPTSSIQIVTRNSTETPNGIRTEMSSTITQNTTLDELSRTPEQNLTEGTAELISITEESTRVTSTSNVTFTPRQTDEPIAKPNTPPPTDCNEDDIDCIIDGTGDVGGWFDCPQMYGHFPHGSSKQLFIHCDNWKPFIKTCAEGTEFSPIYLVCVWKN